MKKEYVKPMLEVEAFAANEYVAACYAVICNGQEQVSSGRRIRADGLHTAHGILAKGYSTAPTTTSKHEIYSQNDFLEWISRGDSPQGVFWEGKEHWAAEVKDIATQKHPNASA